MDLTFSAENPQQNFTVHIIDDRISEPDESFSVVVNSSDDNCVTGRPATVTIIDSDRKISFKKIGCKLSVWNNGVVRVLWHFADNIK